MSIRPAGVDVPVRPPEVATPEVATPTGPAAEGKPTGTESPKALRDGVDAAKRAGDHAMFSKADQKSEVEGPLADPVALSDVLYELAGAELAADPNFQALPQGLQDRLLNLVKNGPPGLAEIFKRLVNSPAFQKLPEAVQAKAAEVLAQLAGEKGDAQLAERLVRSPGFAALPEKEQLKMLDKLANSSEAREELQKTMDAPSSEHSAGFSGPPAEPATMMKIAHAFEGLETNGFPVPPPEEGPIDPNRGGASAEGGGVASRSPYEVMKRLLGKLRALPALSPMTVAHVFGTPLAQTTSDAAFTSFGATIGRGPFWQVGLRESNSALAWRLDLEVRPDVAVLYQQFRGDLIPASRDPAFQPDAGPDGALVFRLGDAHQEVTYVFDAGNERLLSISLERPGTPALSEA